jgi:CyaY protein
MIDELEFRRAADAAIDDLKQELFATEDEGGFEVEEQAGALYVVFEKPAGKFVITPNTPVRQIWISARNTSFKLDFTSDGFVLAKTGETLIPLVKRLIEAHLSYS